MTGRIIHLPGDGHREIQALLPWYLTDTLEPAEAARVRAHLAQCPQCQAELRDEERLAQALAELPTPADALDVEEGWTRISRQIELESRAPEPVSHPQPAPRRAPTTDRRNRFNGWRNRPRGPQRPEAPWLRWAVAAQFFALLVMTGVMLRPQPSPAYHALGSAPAPAAANVVVIFRPETPEKELRTILRANSARLVDGPTEADAYLLHVPPAARAAALARLRKQAQVMLAEPVDAG